jgi:2-polyprenyl-6-methoxyphenol hydroxylase-like FAD-dependent oxidoreductase
MSSTGKKFIVVGGGIGGLAAAVALSQQGVQVTVLEQATELGEIGAGVQLGPNAFAALDSLGVGENARKRAVFTEQLIMMDAVDGSEVGSFPVGQAFRDRFKNPYAVIHRADIHTSLLESTQGSDLIHVETSTKVVSVTQDEEGVTAIDQKGRVFKADALVAADGVRSVIREKMFNDPPRISGHVVYRAVVPVAEMPLDLQINAPVVWAGPDCHLVHYPLRDGQQYNLVVTFHSRQEEEWGVTDGSKEEVLSYFEGICPRARQMLHLPKTWRRWATADRNPLEKWGDGRVTMLGDAAHGMLQYMAQGACMAIEDAVTLGQAMKHCQSDVIQAFQLYEKSRIPRTARVVLSAREMGRLYHVKGVERLVRNQLWVGRTPERFYDALEWLYGWRAENSLTL